MALLSMMKAKTRSPSRRDLWATLLPTAGAVLAYLLVWVVPAWRTAEPTLPSLLLGTILLAGTAAATHRPPLGGATLGVGTLVLPAMLHLAGARTAAIQAAAVFLGAELVRRLLRRHPLLIAERRRLLRTIEGSGRALVATLGGGLLANGLLPRYGLALAAAGAAALYLVLWIGLEIADRKIRRPDVLLDYGKILWPLALDAAGWGVGIAVVLAGRAAGWQVGGALLLALGALALEAARNATASELAEGRIEDLERLRQSARNLLKTGQEMAAVAEQIRYECREVLPFHWFQFELVAPEIESKSWWGTPNTPVTEGAPRPERYPPALPGVHKRTPWRVLDYPLRSEGQLMARLRLWCDPRRLDPDDLRLLERLLPQIGSSVHRSLLDREAREDPLTGVSIRRVLERRLFEVHTRCVEEGGSMAVILCDLDFFKKINDTWGHHAGDEALIAVARILDGHRRETDLCCRYGGEEFTLLLEETEGETALAIAERLRQKVESLELVVGGQKIPVTLSAGVSAFPQLYVKTAAELLLFADAALYEAKRRGRNRCLLDLGQGRYLDAQGKMHVAENAPPVPEPPRIFA